MKERQFIELFRGETKNEMGTIETFLVPIDSTHSFIGKELVIRDGFKLVYYFIPFSNNDAILLVCIEENAQLTDAFKGYSQADLEILKPSFPRMINALQAGNNTNLTNYALLRLDSNGHEFDCVATKVTGVDLLDLETEWLLTKIVEICSFASDLIDELDWDKVSLWQKAKIMGNGIIGGAQTALRVYKISNFLNKL